MAKRQITLKEAAVLSGYAPDYIGQLIRSGKLAGKQVYSNVAWVTTEEDLMRYMQAKKSAGGGSEAAETISDVTMQARNRALLFLQSPKVIKAIMYAALVLCGLFLLVLFYIFSVTVEKRFHERALERVESRE